MKTSLLRMALAIGLGVPCCALAQTNTPPAADPDMAPVKSLGVVTVLGSRPSSLPTQIPTTIEGVTRTQIDQTINATDAEDALKFFPSLLVRRRYIGDYNHAVLSSRASGTGNSARSAVYADGILLSNYLGNGATYAPRWGMVTPEEIERVDVMYGPFSAAYPGNSAGAIVDYVTRMPKALEAQVQIGLSQQKFDLYNSHESDTGGQASASLGSKSGDWSWWINLNRSDSQGQPLVFATLPLSRADAGSTPVASGAMYGLDKTNTPWYIVGTTTQYHTVQDHAKLKLAYDVTPTVRLSYTLGNWRNSAQATPQSYLSVAGSPLYAGTVAIDGKAYTLKNLFSASRDSLDHWMQGLSLKSHSQGLFDWELAMSSFDYGTDLSRTSTVNDLSNLQGTMSNNSATLQDQKGTGWRTVALKGIWRPQGPDGAHIIDLGLTQDDYRLHINKSNLSATDNWLTSAPVSLSADVGGNSTLQGVYAQDAWAFAPGWKTVLGARVENWRTSQGYAKSLVGLAEVQDSYASRDALFVSPKAALAYQWAPDAVLKASLGRAVRMPTVSELYGATSKCTDISSRILATVCPTGQTWVNDPDLRPEKSLTAELTLEKELAYGVLRLTWFNEDVTDSLYSQAVGLKSDGATLVNMVQNIDKVSTQGLEIAYQGENLALQGLDFSGSLTYADSRIVANASYVSLPGDTIGKQQPRVPLWRASLLANYRWDTQLSTSVGLRCSGDQFSTLNNTDINGFAYTAASRFLVVDVRARYALNKHLVLSAGIDNLGNVEYWNYHPYPGRTLVAQLQYRL